MSAALTLDALTSRPDIKGLKILVRADLNVPLTNSETQASHIIDTTRLDRLLPTLEELSQAGARIGILSHFGRPHGQRDDTMSLAPVTKALAQTMGRDIAFSPDCIGETARAALDNLPEGGMVVFENTRFHKGEEANTADFCAALAAPAQAYVNDAFSCAHRAHASTAGLAHVLPAYAGRAMQAELEALTLALEKPARPLMAVVGGSKISTKLDLLINLVEKVDTLAIGGGMANTFLAAQGRKTGQSLCETSMLDTARDIMTKAARQNCQILLPDDVVLAARPAATDTPAIIDSNAVPDDMMILDAGPKTVAHIKAAIDKCKTLVWNGPLGVFEIPPFDTATNAASQYAAACTKKGAIISIAGGGETIGALNHAGVAENFTYISTAGGAFLEWLEGKPLAGVKALEMAAQNFEEEKING